MAYMTQEQRNRKREEVQQQVEQYLNGGGKIKKIPTGAQTSKLDGISFSERTRMEKKSRMEELGLSHFREVKGR